MKSLLALILSRFLPLTSGGAADKHRPNIIWLMAEDMGRDLECYGMAGVKTPNLNRMAREGALFTKACCSDPICSPNRSAMMVGFDLAVIDAQHHRSYVRSARDIWDEIDECSKSISTERFKDIKNHMPGVPWATDQAYLEINRPALHVMRRLKKQGKLYEDEMTFFLESKPGEELHDLQNDPDELNNLAADPEFAAVLKEMRSHEAHWRSENRDHGLEDLDKRQPARGLAAELARDGVRRDEPELWGRLENGELLETNAWMKKYAPRKK